MGESRLAFGLPRLLSRKGRRCGRGCKHTVLVVEVGLKRVLMPAAEGRPRLIENRGFIRESRGVRVTFAHICYPRRPVNAPPKACWGMGELWTCSWGMQQVQASGMHHRPVGCHFGRAATAMTARRLSAATARRDGFNIYKI